MTKRREVWNLNSPEVRDFCSAAALYSEAIEHREGSDGGVRFLMKQFGLTEASARDIVDAGRRFVGHVTVPRAEWDEARAEIAIPLMDRMTARYEARERRRGRRPA